MKKIASIVVAGVLAACTPEPGYEPIDAYSPERFDTITRDELLRDIELNRVPMMTPYEGAELAKRLGGIPGTSGFNGFGPGTSSSGRGGRSTR
jgi:hypothetical protein